MSRTTEVVIPEKQTPSGLNDEGGFCSCPMTSVVTSPSVQTAAMVSNVFMILLSVRSLLY